MHIHRIFFGEMPIFICPSQYILFIFTYPSSKHCFFTIFLGSRQPSFSFDIGQNNRNSSSKTLGLVSVGKPNISAAGKGFSERISPPPRIPRRAADPPPNYFPQSKSAGSPVESLTKYTGFPPAERPRKYHSRSRSRCSSLLVHCGFQLRRSQKAFHERRPFPSIVPGPHIVNPSSPSALIKAVK